jgi:DNA-binding NtrC family response regulator
MVLISTHDLRRAGRLRDAFREAGYATDLVTPDEDVTDSEAAALLVLTGGFEEGDAALAEQAREVLHVPVFAMATGAELSPALRPGYDEVFAGDTSAADVAVVGRTAIERRRLQRITGIVGETDAIREALERVVQIAPVNSTVLVTGESGTGKELVARGIHALSPRKHKPFIAVNVAALSETLLESELFGHEKGAFTGAVDSRRGLFELAHGGTIFLDEIGEMPLATQTKLLRVLEQREFLRVGGEESRRVDVRIIAATNQDLRQLVSIGEFRRDLYFRLNVLQIQLPPLRERRDDIPLLVEEFVAEAAERHDRPFPGISGEAMEILRDYSWPGNVRELRNLVESMVVLAPGRPIRPDDIPAEVRGGRGRTLLPAPIPRAESSLSAGGELRPELEFIFKTLVELRVDMDELRAQFEAYREERPFPGARPIPVGPARAGRGEHAVEVEARPAGEVFFSSREEERPGEDGEDARGGAAGEPSPAAGGGADGGEREEGVVVFRPGKTMEDLEREAIAAALASVDGNRRKAAELLGIGERTLYRKISKYDLEE